MVFMVFMVSIVFINSSRARAYTKFLMKTMEKKSEKNALYRRFINVFMS